MKPSTDHDWAIHAINIHGVFFERWCQQTIDDTGNWAVRSTNYPVAYGGEQSALDIHASHRLDDTEVSLLIECKKNNPELTNWVFFPKRKQSPPPRFRYAAIENSRPRSTSKLWYVARKQINRPSKLLVADDAREVRGTYVDVKQGNKTKTSNAAISDAAFQIALATQSLILQEQGASEFHAKINEHTGSASPPYESHIFIPAIVTTARLFSCEFDPAAINIGTGEIPLDEARLIELPYLVYEYPLPDALQHMPENPELLAYTGDLEHHVRMHILVIHSARLDSVLRRNLDIMGQLW